LHPAEIALAKYLAAKSGGKYTLQQIEDALRWANYKNETATTGIAVPLNGSTSSSAIYDPGMSLSYTNGNAVMYQDLSQVAQPSADLMAFIQQNTGSTYSWNTSAWVTPTTPKPLPLVPTSNGPVSQYGSGYNAYSYSTSTVVNDHAISLTVAGCPAAGCANSDPITWADHRPTNQGNIQAYNKEIIKQGEKDGVTITAAGLAFFFPPSAIGTIGGGAVLGGGTSMGYQYIDNGTIDPTTTLWNMGTGAFVGGVTLGTIKGSSWLDTATDNAFNAFWSSTEKPAAGQSTATFGNYGGGFGPAANDASYTESVGSNGALKNPSGDTNASADAGRNQVYGNGGSASPSPGTETAGSPGGNVQWTAGVGGISTSEGTANAATYQDLKNQLTNQNLANIAALDTRLETAVYGDGSGSLNFSIGTGSATEADSLGQAWVGDGARPMNGVPGGLVSADGTRVYRPPTAKPNTPTQYAPTGVQANFQLLENGVVVSNGHLNVSTP
jgi:hypothetical protein